MRITGGFTAGLSGPHVSHVFTRQCSNHHFSVLNQNNGTGYLLKTRGCVLISLGLFLTKFLLVTVAKTWKSLDFFLSCYCCLRKEIWRGVWPWGALTGHTPPLLHAMLASGILSLPLQRHFSLGQLWESQSQKLGSFKRLLLENMSQVKKHPLGIPASFLTQMKGKQATGAPQCLDQGGSVLPLQTDHHSSCSQRQTVTQG